MNETTDGARRRPTPLALIGIMAATAFAGVLTFAVMSPASAGPIVEPVPAPSATVLPTATQPTISPTQTPPAVCPLSTDATMANVAFKLEKAEEEVVAENRVEHGDVAVSAQATDKKLLFEVCGAGAKGGNADCLAPNSAEIKDGTATLTRTCTVKLRGGGEKKYTVTVTYKVGPPSRWDVKITEV